MCVIVRHIGYIHEKEEILEIEMRYSDLTPTNTVVLSQVQTNVHYEKPGIKKFIFHIYFPQPFWSKETSVVKGKQSDRRLRSEELISGRRTGESISPSLLYTQYAGITLTNNSFAYDLYLSLASVWNGLSDRYAPIVVGVSCKHQ